MPDPLPSQPTPLPSTDAGATPDPAPPGDRFTVVRLHAKGGLGQVSLATDTKLRRPVALKEIRPDKRDNARLRQRFLTEAEITGQLEHPGIVPIYDLEEGGDGQVRYAMRFVQGRTLGDAIRDHHRGPTAVGFRDLLQRVVSVCQTVAYAHSQRVIHRDLKPANVLLGDYGETLVVDWGLAKRVGSPGGSPSPSTAAAEGDDAGQTTDHYGATDENDPLTQAGQVLGTPTYMAPEQAAGDVANVGPAADVYALGAILYEVLTDRPPYPGKAVAEVLAAVRRGEVVPPTQVRRGVPAALEAVCLKAMAHDLARRYASAADLADDVRHWLADEPVAAYPEPLAARAARAVRRNQAWAAGVGALLLTGLVALGISNWLVREEQWKTSQALGQEQEARTEADAQRGNAVAALRESRLVAANLALERGQTLGDQGDAATGLLWFVRGLELAPEDAGPVRGVLRANLAAWSGQVGALRSRLEHTGSVTAAAYAPDGRTILTGTLDPQKAIWVWDLATGQPMGKPIALPSGETGANLAFRPDGKWALTGSRTGKAHLWNLDTRLLERVLKATDVVLAVAFRGDGKVAATGCADGTAHIWDLATGNRLGDPLRHAKGRVDAVAFSPDGKVLMTGGTDGNLLGWDSTTGKRVGPTVPVGSPIRTFVWAPGGQTVVVSTLSAETQAWDVTTGKPAGPPIRHPGTIHAVALTKDGRMLLTGGGDGIVRRWDVATGAPVGQPLPHKGIIAAVAFAPDGGRVMTASSDFSVRVWQPGRGDPRFSAARLDPAMEKLPGVMAVRPDGRVVAFSSLRGGVQFADPTTGSAIGPVRTTPGPVISLAFSPDGKKVLVGSAKADLYHADTWEPASRSLPHQDTVTAVAFSGDGRFLATATWDGMAQLWDATTGKPVGLPAKHPDPRLAMFRTVAVAPDGKTVATGGIDGTVHRWEVATGKMISPPLNHEGVVEIQRVSFSADGTRLASGGADKAARIWDAATGQPHGPPLRHQGQVFDVTFSPDGRLLLTAGGDRTVRLWDVATGKRIGPHLHHPDAVRRATFGADPTDVVTVTAARVVGNWKVLTRLPDDVPRLALWAQVVSGQELDPDGGVHALTAAEWAARREKLAARGGSPLPE